MKIELKRIEHSERMSEETNCFTADLWVDGKKIGQVGNDGQGGCDRFYGDQAAYDRADQWCKSNLPPTELGHGLGSTMTDIELHVAALLEDYLCAKDIKAKMRTKALFIRPDAEGLYAIGYKGRKAPDADLFAQVAKRHPGAVILNTMAIDAAVAAAKKAGVA